MDRGPKGPRSLCAPGMSADLEVRVLCGGGSPNREPVGQGRHREVGSEGSPRQAARAEGHELGMEVVMVGRDRKRDRSPRLPMATAIDRAAACEMVSVLTRGDLPTTRIVRNPRPQGAAEAAGVSRGHSTGGVVFAAPGRAERQARPKHGELAGPTMTQLPLNWGRDGSGVVKPQATIAGPSRSAARTEAKVRTTANARLEDALERTNLQRALRRVEQNAGAPGIDGMAVEELRPYLRENWPRIARSLLDGSYRPTPVRRVFIPKSCGGQRPLGIPTALDRFLQQALLQALQPLFDREFSPHSFGFRPGKSAHQAVSAARAHIAAGYSVVVDIDIASFFDRVNHDVLMGHLAQRIGDGRILRLIRRYLEAGVLVEGVKVRSETGTPQGGPLSPLLANVLLDDLDQELGRRGHRFVRYADDCNVYVRSRRAGERVMVGLRQFLSRRLKLQVNEAKSAVDLATRRGFLGFSFYGREHLKVRLDPQSLRRVKAVIRQHTHRARSMAMAKRIRQLNEYLVGWVGYFALADTPSVFEDLDKWLRRRLRACRWKEWKRGRTRYHMFRKLGLPERDARQGFSKKGVWRMAGVGAMQWALSRSYWADQGLCSLVERYAAIRVA